MCGLTGVAGNLYGKDIEAARDLLWANAVRGFHSTGVALIPNAGKTHIFKDVGSPMNVFANQGFANEFNMNKRVIIGHNRHATIGKRIPENAHPFEHGDIIGAHNGTIDYRGQNVLAERDRFETDSEALFYNINHFGVESVIKEMTGAWALTWYDKSNDTINFLRNKERPFSYCFNDDGTVLYWASEADMLRWVLNRRGVKYGPMLGLLEDTWVSFTVPKGNQKWGEPLVTEVKGYERPPFKGSGTDRNIPWEVEDYDDWAGWRPHQKSLQLGPATIGPGTKDESSAGKNVVWLQKQKQNDEKPKESGGKSASKKSTQSLPGIPSTEKTSHDYVMTAIETAYQEGCEAGDKGWSISRNPYPTHSFLHTEWLEGRRFGLSSTAVKARTAPKYVPTTTKDEQRVVKGYNSEVLSVREFLDRTNGICAWAGCDIDHDEELRWFGRNEAVCQKCFKGEQLMKDMMRA